MVFTTILVFEAVAIGFALTFLLIDGYEHTIEFNKLKGKFEKR